MDKIAETKIENGKPQPNQLVVPKGVDADKFYQASKAKALMRAEITPEGSALVNCPYCIMFWRVKNPVDVTKFIDHDGKKEHTAACSKGHVLKFKSIPQWREERQKMGLQVKS